MREHFTMRWCTLTDRILLQGDTLFCADRAPKTAEDLGTGGLVRGMRGSSLPGTDEGLPVAADATVQ